ncbi:MAG TPA: putative oxidoreductase C-terminal domain-containing protein [Pyrinomonadaceae bacterium]|nr:putative oxidoreductase C-terminal domain-containing protein [Pyrinomonadaceae bacterium]
MSTQRQREPQKLKTFSVKILLVVIGLTGGIFILQKASSFRATAQESERAAEVRFITLAPGHFHAALVLKEMYPGVSKQVSVYAPLDADLIDHLQRISLFNNRKDNPTSWEINAKTGADFLERMLKERPGNVVVLSGRNQGKIDLVNSSLNAGLNVLVDKPWILYPADLPKMEVALDTAEKRGLIAYDIMTERHEITTMLQKEIVNDTATFGKVLPGTEREPGVYMESVHHLMKTVAGVPNPRPARFFDIEQQGEGINDVGTHLVDLVPWMLFPEQPIDYRRDIQVLSAERWPTVVSRENFQRITREAEFPAYLSANVKDDQLQLFANTDVLYRLRGIHVRLKPLWNYEAPAGAGDTHLAVFRGTLARVEVRQGKEQKYVPELYVVPNDASRKTAVLAALRKKIEALQSKFPGIAIEDSGAELHINIPAKYREGHEAHFAAVTKQFLSYLKNPKSLPAWEKTNMLAKYYVTTKAVEMSRRSPRRTVSSVNR